MAEKTVLTISRDYRAKFPPEDVKWDQFELVCNHLLFPAELKKHSEDYWQQVMRGISVY